jgi:hypothetical protein
MTKRKSQRGHQRLEETAKVRMRPLNLAARFLLEIAALVALGNWGYHMRDDGWRYLLAAAFPIVAAAVWGIFAVPGDPSRSGTAPVRVPGAVRLGIELVFFGLAAYAMFAAGMQALALVFSVAVAVHYVASLPRIRWLLNQ